MEYYNNKEKRKKGIRIEYDQNNIYTDPNYSYNVERRKKLKDIKSKAYNMFPHWNHLPLNVRNDICERYVYDGYDYEYKEDRFSDFVLYALSEYHKKINLESLIREVNIQKVLNH